MVKESDISARSSVHVAPLSIKKDASRGLSHDQTHRRNTSSRSSTRTRGESISSGSQSQPQSQMTPPATPNGSQEDLHQHVEPPPPVFHSFLRAFYPFQPTYAIADTTVTLPLQEGDVILVHSIHTNGWADGTVLVSGARGWLPTNYCEAYDPDAMRSLLKALLNFWDLMRSGYINDNAMFGNQEFMRGIIAGVRYLLVGTLSCHMQGANIDSKLLGKIALLDPRFATCRDQRWPAQESQSTLVRLVIFGQDSKATTGIYTKPTALPNRGR
jgi:hypothetical protein